MGGKDNRRKVGSAGKTWIRIKDQMKEISGKDQDQDSLRRFGDNIRIGETLTTISLLALAAAGTDDTRHQVTDGTRRSPYQLW